MKLRQVFYDKNSFYVVHFRLYGGENIERFVAVPEPP